MVFNPSLNAITLQILTHACQFDPPEAKASPNVYNYTHNARKYVYPVSRHLPLPALRCIRDIPRLLRRVQRISNWNSPSRIIESQLKIWKEIVGMNFLTTPLSGSIKVAEKLYHLRPYVNSQLGYSQEQTDMHHALVRLAE